MDVRLLVIGKNSFVGKNIRLYSKFDTIDFISLREVKPENIPFFNYDVVIFLAAIVHQSKRIPDAEYFWVNSDLAFETALLAKEHGIKQFIYLSTIKVYGSKSDHRIRTENSPCFPDDAYGKSKYQAELRIKPLNDEHFTVSIIRTPIVYGEGVKANMLKLVQLVDKFPILPLGNLHNKRNITFVGNLVGFLDRIIELRSPGVFIAMDEEAVSTSQLVHYIAKALNKKARLLKIPVFIIKAGQKIFPGIFNKLFGSLEFDNTMTKADLGFKAPYSVESGIKIMVEAYKNNK